MDGIVYGSGEFADTASDIFVIDIDDSTNTPTLIFRDGDGDETFMWNDPVGELQMTNDLSVGGDLTIEKLLLVGSVGGHGARFL